MTVIIRFCYAPEGNEEDDKLEAQIRNGQYGFWATHCEAVWPDRYSALRYDDIAEGWYLTDEEDTWLRQTIVEIPCPEVQSREFYNFLGDQMGKPYDMRLVAGIPVHFENHKGDRWSCAHMLYAALIKAGLVRSAPREMVKVSVRDLMIVIGAITALPPIQERASALRTEPVE